MSVGAVLTRLREAIDHAVYGPAAPALQSVPDLDDDDVPAPTYLQLTDEADDGTRIYSDAEITADGRPSYELIVYPVDDEPATRVDTLLMWIEEQ